MDEVIWDKCKELLRKEWAENPSQAVIVVSHYDDEVSCALPSAASLTCRCHGRKAVEGC